MWIDLELDPVAECRAHLIGDADLHGLHGGVTALMLAAFGGVD